MKHNKIFYLISGKSSEVANTLLLRLFYDDDAVTEDFCWMCICVDPCRGEREARVLDLRGVIDVTSESRTYGRTCRSLSGFPSWSWGTLGPFLCRRRSRCPRVWWRTPPQHSAWTSPCTAGETYKMCMWGCVRTETVYCLCLKVDCHLLDHRLRWMRRQSVSPDPRRTTESSADTRLVRISCLADTSGTCGSPRELVLMPSHASFLIWAMPLQGHRQHS